jgi:hypothetical protein
MDGLKVNVMPKKDPLGLTLLERLGVRVRLLTRRDHVSDGGRERLALNESDCVEEVLELKVRETVVLPVSSESVNETLWLRLIVVLLLSDGVRVRRFRTRDDVSDWLSELLALPEMEPVSSDSVNEMLWLRLIVAVRLMVGVRVRLRFRENVGDWLSELLTLAEKDPVNSESVKEALWLRLSVVLLLRVGVRVRFRKRENVND